MRKFEERELIKMFPVETRSERNDEVSFLGTETRSERNDEVSFLGTKFWLVSVLLVLTYFVVRSWIGFAFP